MYDSRTLGDSQLQTWDNIRAVSWDAGSRQWLKVFGHEFCCKPANVFARLAVVDSTKSLRISLALDIICRFNVHTWLSLQDHVW